MLLSEQNSHTNSSKKTIRKVKLERTFRQRSNLYHNYYKRSGHYSFIGKNLLRVIVVISLFSLGAWAVTNYIVDLNTVMAYLTGNAPNWVIVSTLYISESTIGLAPPDLYIFWAKTLQSPYMMVLWLALASYIGGVTAYFIGNQLFKLPKIKHWVNVKFDEQFKIFKKYSGLFIIISALAPLPFSWVSIVSGVVKYPIGWYLLFALSRIVRFFVYAYFFFRVV
jgi:membrane protein YqaA with SNARE-associated domain